MGECTYCITRFARGRLKSYSIKKIVSATDKWLKRGVKEIKLTAQDTAAYGMDYDDGTNIYELVSKIVKLKGDFRIRIGMMNPKSAIKILPKIIDMYRYEKVYKFLHLPLQSGDNRVLSRMMRGYTVEDFIYVIKKVRSAVNNLMLSTDIIVGFPGETADEFEKSIEVIKQIKPDIVNITRFSAREGTAAAHMKPQVVSRIAKERSRILSELRFKISKEINTKFVGSFEKILLTERGKNNTFVGRTSAYRPVVIDANNFKIGDFVNVKIIFAMPTYLIGKPV
jgi:MiaB-like tRNA modifying enzyme